jgi:threonine/homoserine/homoserine lactone efflux protein
MGEYALSAFIFGLTAGFNPGPLGIVIIQQTLEHGLRSGLKACLAPIITDGPIIIAALFILGQLNDKTMFIGALSLVGGLYLLWVAFKIFRIKETNLSSELAKPNSLQIAIKVNLLNPNPYLFWFTVGGTYLALGTRIQSALFIAVAVGTLVACKMFTAWVAAYFREMLESKVYVWLMRFLALLLVGFGALFLVRSHNLLLTS